MIFLIIFVFCKLSEASLFKNAMVNSNSSDSEPSKYHSFSLDSVPIVANTLETALTDAAESADLDEGADNENFISNVLQKVFMDSMGSSMRRCLELVAGIPELEHRCFSIAFDNDYFWS